MGKKKFQLGEQRESEKEHLLAQIREWKDNIQKTREKLAAIRRLQKLNQEDYLLKRRKKFWFKIHASELGSKENAYIENKENNIKEAINFITNLFNDLGTQNQINIRIQKQINIGEIVGIKINIPLELREKLWEINPNTIIQQTTKYDNIAL